MSALGTILKDNWEWRSQIFQLALFDLKKQSRGAGLGWAWFIIKPAVYIFCFWFAIDVGLKASHAPSDGAPYILWLCSGMVPWFYVQSMLGGGINVMKKYPYLVNRVKFPISAISNIFAISSLIQQLMLQVLLFVVYFACGQPLDLYLLQVPVLIVVMYVFWLFYSIMMSPLTVISKDVKNLMSALSTPFFWLSGVIFNVNDLSFEWIQTVLYFNPITFFVTAFRDALYDRVWVWEDPMLLIGFGIVFVITVAMAVYVYSRTNEVVADVL